MSSAIFMDKNGNYNKIRLKLFVLWITYHGVACFVSAYWLNPIILFSQSQLY